MSPAAVNMRVRGSDYMLDLSIVTVVRNDQAGCLMTAASIADQTISKTRFEHIVIDGSDDGSTSTLQATFDQQGATFVAGFDAGVYQAMNEGLRRAGGRFILYLNAGDFLASPTSLAHLLDDKPSQGRRWIVGQTLLLDAQRVDGRMQDLGPFNLQSALRGKTWAPHPSTAYEVTALREVGTFDESFRISADHHVMLRMLRQAGAPATTQSLISVHVLGGLSTTHTWLAARENLRARLLESPAIARPALALRWLVQQRQYVSRHTRKVPRPREGLSSETSQAVARQRDLLDSEIKL